MASNCDVCGKGPSFGHSISHSHRRTKRRWNPNIQRVKALVGVGGGTPMPLNVSRRLKKGQRVVAPVAGVTPKRLNVCTSCLKAGKVKR